MKSPETKGRQVMRSNSSNTATDRTGATVDASKGVGRLFAVASILARKGRYADATKLLQKALDARECSTADALDLQARIYAQQGLYLQAESCWRKALALDGTNTAYADALARLRRPRRPIGPLYQVLVFGAGLVVFGVLLWQIMLANQAMHRLQDAADQSLGAIRGDIGSLQSGSQLRDHELATSLLRTGEALSDLETRLSERLGAMPTASGMKEHRNAIIEHMDEEIAALRNTISQEMHGIDKHRNEVEGAQADRVQRIETTVGRIDQTVSGIKSAVAKRVDAMEASIREGMKSLVAAKELSALQRSVVELKTQLGDLADTVRSLRQSGSGNKPDDNVQAEESVKQLTPEAPETANKR